MNRQEFIAEIAPVAVADQMQSRVLASITIAQGMLESAYGNHAPGENLFGIKSTDGTGQYLWTREYVNGKLEDLQAWFRVYPDWSGSIADHSEFLTVNGRYTRAGFFDRCAELDYVGAARALQTAGYATDPKYAAKLIGIIEQYELYKYDKEAVSNLQEIEDLKNRVAVLEEQVMVLEKTSAPDWFLTEFGDDEINGFLKDATGDVDFWRNFAVMLRVFNKKQ